MSIVKWILGFLLTAVVASNAHAAPKFSVGVSVRGATAYQDDQQQNVFHYVPTSVDVVYGRTLKDFKATYWGIGKPFYVKTQDGVIRSVTGAVLSGKANIDISDDQRVALKKEIKRAFGVENPTLKPIEFSKATVTPVLAENTLLMGKGGDVDLPEKIVPGTDFSFLIATGNNLFGSTVGAANQGWKITPNSHFAVTVVGEAQFVGDPWRATVTADLSQVWSEVRKRFSASIKLGWFRIGSADYHSLVQDLQKRSIIRFEMSEGSLEYEKHGRQIFEAARQVFEAINAQATAGKGFFRFEPNPRASDIKSGSHGKFAGWWGVSINGGHSSARLSQKIEYKNEITYTGRFWHRIPMSATLAVSCNQGTADLFVDLSDTTESCITDEKSDETRTRLARELAAKTKKIVALQERYALGEVTAEQYDRLLDLYQTVTLTSDVYPTPFDVRGLKGWKEASGSAMHAGIPEAILRSLEDAAMK